MSRRRMGGDPIQLRSSILALFIAAVMGASFLGVAASPLYGSAAASSPQLPGWTNVTAGSAPVAMAGAMMAYSSVHHRFVLFGGWDGDTGLNQTWVYDPANATWTELHPTVTPMSRGDEMLAYDDRADVFVLFGGWHEEANESYVRLSDTWTFSLPTGVWTQKNPNVFPSPRSDAMVSYDPREDAVLLFGGFDGSHYLGDVWSFIVSNDTWMPRPASVQPSPRADGRMVYVPGQDRFVLFGGNDYTGPNFTFHHLADTWTYNWTSNVWASVMTGVAPSARDYPIFAADPASGRLLLTAGYGDKVILNDLWAFNLTTNTWSDITPATSPPPRYAGAGGFAPDANGFVIFSGAGTQGLLADTWTYRSGPAVNGSGISPVELLAGIAVGTGLLVAAIAVVVARRRHSRSGTKK